jgi:hypothetical protein
MLSLEELKRSVVGNNVYTVTDQFVLPLEEGFEDGNGLHLEHAVIMLCRGEFL